jgi:RNA polymerase sigma-70 factor (ECF subfamily)
VSGEVEAAFRQDWGRAVAVVARLTGDVGVAEDAVQEAMALALDRWPAGPLPSDPAAWLIAVAKNRALDQVRREARRPGKEEAAVLLLAGRNPPRQSGMVIDDRLRLIFTCCHPALDPGVRIALTLRTLCGLIARVFLVSEATMAQRRVRGKRKIRDAAIPYRVPADHELPGRIGSVLRVVYLVFTEGHRASSGERAVRGELCEEAIRLSRLLAGLCPDDPEVLGLLALLLLTDARRPARASADGPLQAAIAACHAAATSAADTDWAEITALYAALAHHDPSPVIQANRAVAVAMADGPAAGLAILDEIHDARSAGWHLLHACRADLLSRLGRTAEAGDAYRAALALGPPPAEAEFLAGRLAEADAATVKPKGQPS